MARPIWKGAVTFGLVYIPVEMHSASRSSTLDLDLLDRRDFAPVGYQRVNKRTGKTVDWGDIVKGYQYKKGDYVVLSDEDFRQANVKASQTIEIESFTNAVDIPPEYYEMPYYLSPTKGGEKGYALLREALQRAGRVGLGNIVMRGRQHLCAILSEGRALVLNTLRFAEEVRSTEELELPPASAKASKIASREVELAEKLIEEMTAAWHPQDYHDTYRQDLMKRIEEKVRKKQTHVLTPKEKAPKEERQSAQVIDLMSVLRKSLESRGAAGGGAATSESRAASSRRSDSGVRRQKRTARSRSRA
jgi:DNA end-binding protein Ku